MGIFKELSIGGLVGLLVGIGLVTWVEPGTAAGVALILLVCVAVGTLVGGIVSIVLAMKKSK